jgi:hypothetical protein
MPVSLLDQVRRGLDLEEVRAISNPIKYLVGHDGAATVLSKAIRTNNFVGARFTERM